MVSDQPFLRKARRTVPIAFASSALLAVIAIIYFTAEPTYHGVPITKWLEDYRAAHLRLDLQHLSLANWDPGDRLPQLPDVPLTDPKYSHDPAIAAVRHMHDKALPLLVKWLSFRPSPWETRLSKLATKLPRCVQTSAAIRSLSPDKGYDRIELALIGLVILRSNAVTVIPDLARIAADPPAPGSYYAIRALIEIGPPAVPALTNLLTGSRSVYVKQGIRAGLGRMGASANQAVAALVRELKSPDILVASHAAAILGQIGQYPDIVVPALTAALDDYRWHIRQCAAAALRNFGTAASSAVPKLKSLLGNHNGNVYLVDEAARMTLREIAPEELTNAPEWKPTNRGFPFPPFP
jgi:hypothetical protein